MVHLHQALSRLRQRFVVVHGAMATSVPTPGCTNEPRFRVKWLALFLLTAYSVARAQAPLPGERGTTPGAGEEVPPDTVFVFASPRPLVNHAAAQVKRTSGGIAVLFSQSGFGMGVFYQHWVTDLLWASLELGISGARNSSEIESLYDPISGRLLVPGKINRLFIFPLTIGIGHRLFDESLSESLRPFVSAGVGPTLVVSTPYEYEFFQSWSYARGYVRFGSFVGVGLLFGPQSKSDASFNIRYYYIPFGGNGLESIQGQPIRTFGGVFLTLAIGF
ncbi:MAG: hypothetical protein KatS3mg039_0910 [Candidatus Kapaibacterium sp.]|nr:MAG: hypothetical protein KatS3mg039_0910 [Candidatus Kapabacteria bacterium]